MSPDSTKTPHLTMKNVGFDADRRTAFDIAMLRAPKYRTVLENVSFELFGGESMAIMYTSGKVFAFGFGHGCM